MQDSDQSSILLSNSDFYITDMCTHVIFQILKSMAFSHFLKSTSNDVTDVCPNSNP